MDKPGKTVRKQRPRHTFTHAFKFKAEAVRLCRIGDRSISQVAKDLDLTETALRERSTAPTSTPARARPVPSRATSRPNSPGSAARSSGSRWSATF
jgi:transposase-like protein